MGIKSLVKNVLIEQQNKKYTRLLENKAVTYDQWIRERESTLAWKSDAVLMQKEYVCICMPNGQLAVGAYSCIAQWFAEHPECKILYADEDIVEFECGLDGKVKSAVRKSPWFKPDWSPDLLKRSFYFGSMVAMRKELWEQMLAVTSQQTLADIGVEQYAVTGLYQVVDIVPFQDFIRCCVVTAGGYQRDCQAVQHIPEVLFHAYSEDLRKHYAVQDTIDACIGNRAPESNNCEGGNKITLSVIIPSKDNPDILEKCLAAIQAAAGKLSYEIIAVDNGSSEENRQRIEALVAEHSVKTSTNDMAGQENTYLYHPQEFNFSKMCNMGAEAARGELLLFLNDDVELAQAECLEKLAVLAQHEYTGAVGIKLYYPDSKRIQHAGITNLPMGPVHKLQFLEDDKDYYFAYNRGCRNVLAVTAACLMVEKEKFNQAGGFSEELRVAFNDVDFCFRLYELGYINVCQNDCFAYHHESLSRGDDESTEKLNRLLAERDKLYARHPRLKGVDPYYGAGLGRDGLDTRIRPAYETAGNQQQQISGALTQMNPEEYREDYCLLFRVEDSREGRVQGYGVVLGDNNACYDRWLVLKKDNLYFSIKIDGQYRPDLIENLPDQTNVGLCGVWIHLTGENLPEGSYRLGMAVRNRVTGLKLINWSNRTLEM